MSPRVSDEDEPETSPVERAPGGQRIRVTPGGRLGTGDKTDATSQKYACDSDRIGLAALDNRQRFTNVIGAANRNNVSFYTIDPRGLTPFDTAVQTDPPAGVDNPFEWDRASLATRQSAMRDLANNTDGLSVVDSLQFDRSLRRIADDLSSYYLVGYYSTNARLDGKYREVTVRVKRAGVDVRARRGYRAATKAEIGGRVPATASSTPDTPVAAPLPKPAVFRRGPATGNRLEPTDALVFSRTERLHLETPIEPELTAGPGRFLDRAGQPMNIPVTIGERRDPEGRRWLTADVTLAPLAPGDYAVELSATIGGAERRVITAIRVVR